MCIGNARFIEPLCYTLADAYWIGEQFRISVEFSSVTRPSSAGPRSRACSRCPKAMQNAGSPRRNSGVCAPKQELHAYPFILENPCRDRKYLTHTQPGRRATDYRISEVVSRVPGCIYVHALVTYFPPFDPFPTRLTMALCEIRHYANISSGEGRKIRDVSGTDCHATTCRRTFPALSSFAVPFVSPTISLVNYFSAPRAVYLLFSAIVSAIV